ncbi:MAG: thioredoxin family protein [Rubripirellula sp.]
MDYASKFASGLEYQAFLESYGNDQHRARWATHHDQVSLTIEQTSLLESFVREMKVIVFAGAWCGDCANQCPIFDHFAKANSKLKVRFFDRDDNPDLGEIMSTCGAQRVPSLLFLSEDDHVCGRYGDRTLAKYREMADKQLGNACPTGIGGEDQQMLNQVVQEWLNEFERIQLMLRLSGRLRKLHDD